MSIEYYYLFYRLDEQPSSRWKPQLSAPEFQALLSNLTAIKIRVTFGEEGVYANILIKICLHHVFSFL